MKYGFQSKEAEKFPQMVLMSLCNVCNNRCVHCEYSHLIKTEDYRPIFFDKTLFKEVVDEISHYKIDLLRLTSNGEPLLHPNLLEMLRYAKEKGVEPVNVTTNGILLTPDVSEQLIEAGLDFIDVSIDAFTEAGYKKICRTGYFHQIVENVHNFIEMNTRYGNSVKVFVSMIDQREVEDEIDDFRRYWEPKVDRVLVRTYYHGKSRDRSKVKYDFSVVRYPCHQLWKRVLISHDGYIRFCVNDWYNKSVIGDLNKGDTIYDVWYSEAYQTFRNYHLSGEFDRMKLCGKCEDWRSSTWEYGYDYALKTVLKDGD
jgi:wyosine [tRNA(Phe)-imidazoG37] synthetase (radical SAM superfamily)